MNINCFRGWMSLVVLMCVIFSAGPVFAQGQGLATVGPTDPANGYPTAYVDKNGLALASCLVSPNDPAAPVFDPCGLTGTLPAGDNSAIAFPANFPDEFFYNRAFSVINAVGAGGGGKALLAFALEGAFGGATGTSADGAGAQIVFARFRVRVTAGLTPGATYTVTHPFGVTRFTASSAGTINFTDDFGCLATPPACNFSLPLPTTNIGPFLRWDPAVAPAAPVGYIGDPAVTHRITGSPFGTNRFQIDGPNIGGTGVNRVTSDQFTVIGKIGKQATTTSLVSSLNPSTSGQAVTFRATVTPSTATGTITFFDGATALSGAVNMVGGAASFTTSALAVGTHSITARYSGSATFLGSTSNTVSQVVNNVAAGRANTTTTLVASPNPVQRNASVTLRATVTSPAGGNPTGTVTFTDTVKANGNLTTTTLATVQLAPVASGGSTATFTTTFALNADHTLRATYGGDANFNGSTGSVVLRVQ